ncbi:G1 family glutamic endopeptidase [Tardisphaera saccharovorans]
MSNRAFRGYLSILLFLLPFLAISPAAAAPVIGGPMVPLRLGSTSTTSLNWAGYVITAGDGSVNSVTGSFVVPSVTGTSGTTYVALWVGIDGYNDRTVEQTGIMIEDNGGALSYYVWYEYYPKSPVYAPSSDTVSPGETVEASVTYSHGEFDTTIEAIVNNEVQWTFSSGPTKVNGANDDSAEFIVERPSTLTGPTSLADFGTAEFGQYYTGISGTCTAVINGQTYTLATAAGSTSASPALLLGPGQGHVYGKHVSSSSSVGLVSITMVDSAGTTLAAPNPYLSDGTSFTVTYYNSN